MADRTCPNCEKLSRENADLRKSLESAALGRHSRLLGVNGHNATFSTCPHSDCKDAREALEGK